MNLQDIKVNNTESEKAILEGINFTWEGNGAIGVIGESGAGKSTLIDVLAGFLSPSSGKMLVNGLEVDGSTREDWQKNIAYIPQQPYIFPLSLKDNIRFYETNATDEEVERVINEVGTSFTRYITSKWDARKNWRRWTYAKWRTRTACCYGACTFK